MIELKERKGLKKAHKREYTSWVMMKQRCLNPNDKDFINYGGRSIIVCQEWIDSFEKFYNDMGDRPENYSIERKDINGNYTKDNCIWSTSKTQAMNRRSNKLVTYNGETKPLMKLCEELDVDYFAVWYKLKQGIDIEKAIITKSKYKGRGVNKYKE